MPKRPQRSKNNSKIILIASIVIGLSFIISGFLIFSNYVLISDDKITPVLKGYIIIQQLEKNVEDNYFSVSAKPYYVDFLSKIEFKTSSRSAQNPINVQISMEPTDEFFNPKEEALDLLPNKLHYVFEGAHEQRAQEITLNKLVEIELEKKKQPLGYFGEKTIIFEDSGTYNFYLKEHLTTMEEGLVTIGNGSFSIFHDPSDPELKTFIIDRGEVGENTMVIQPYQQTIEIESLKMQWYGTFFGIGATAIGTFITVFIKMKKSHSNS